MAHLYRSDISYEMIARCEPISDFIVDRNDGEKATVRFRLSSNAKDITQIKLERKLGWFGDAGNWYIPKNADIRQLPCEALKAT